MTGMFYMKIIRPLVVSLGLSLAGLTHAAGYGVIDLERIVENSTYLKQQNASLRSIKLKWANLIHCSNLYRHKCRLHFKL